MGNAREIDQFCDLNVVDELTKAAGDGMKGEGAMQLDGKCEQPEGE